MSNPESIAFLVDPNEAELPYRLAVAIATANLCREKIVDSFLVWIGAANPHYSPPPVPWLGLDDLYGFQGTLVATCPASLAVAEEIKSAKRILYYAWNPSASNDYPVVARTEKHRKVLEAAGAKVVGICEMPEVEKFLAVDNRF